MGVRLAPIVRGRPINLDALRDRRLAVDGNGELYQFLALIRLPDGTPLRDSHGRITSHLNGLFYRVTRLIADYRVQLVFVFDGAPPELKAADLARRRAVRARYDAELAEARAAGDLARAYSKATMTSRLSGEMVREAVELLRLLGIPAVMAPSEGEAQAAHMARAGPVWAAVSKDFDTLLFGAPRHVRFMTISGKEFLPSRGAFRPITPELIELAPLVDELGVTHEQLVDLAILIGTDFNPGIRGIGPKRALALVRKHGAIEAMPPEIRAEVEAIAPAIRELYLRPDVTDDYSVEAGGPDIDGVVRFLCEERAFSESRVRAALGRAFPQG
ncbi:MAG TPA: flap endonuclease-1 [Vicinamibacterales bacterium]